MIVETKQFIVRVGGVMMRLSPGGFAQERDYQINNAMKKLYREGCRRMRVVRLPSNGDYARYRVMGWAA